MMAIRHRLDRDGDDQESLGGCSSLLSQPVALSVFSGSGPSQSKHWEALERTLALAAGRQREGQVGPAVGASRSFSLAHGPKNLSSMTYIFRSVPDVSQAKIVEEDGNVFDVTKRKFKFCDAANTFAGPALLKRVPHHPARMVSDRKPS